MPKILQINYTLNVPVRDFVAAAAPVAETIAAVPGLRWKIWLANDNEQEGGGIYLFDDDDSLRAFVDGPIIARLKANPALRALNIKQFDSADAVTAITRGPL